MYELVHVLYELVHFLYELVHLLYEMITLTLERNFQMFQCPTPVSYTHLDVYKRQAEYEAKQCLSELYQRMY